MWTRSPRRCSQWELGALVVHFIRSPMLNHRIFLAIDYLRSNYAFYDQRTDSSSKFRTSLINCLTLNIYHTVSTAGYLVGSSLYYLSSLKDTHLLGSLPFFTWYNDVISIVYDRRRTIR